MPTKPMPGGRWLHELRAVYADTASMTAEAHTFRTNQYFREGVMGAMQIIAALDDPETRRIIVDSEQAVRFTEAADMPPVERYRLPFDQMYIEFTRPLDIREQEPGYEDELIGMIVLPTHGREGVPPETVQIKFITRSLHPVLRTNPITKHDWSEQTACFNLLTGTALSHPQTFLEPARPGAPDSVTHDDISQYPDGFLAGLDLDRDWIAARDEGAGRGWWERTISDYARFTAWLLTYMTAKGIVIVEAEMTRQQRRAAARLKHRPSPWHIVTVDPTVVRDFEPGEGGGRSHSYRYDVRGHLRFGRHKRGDGSYSQTVEWVRPHQRGLANTIYVPKTYVYDAKSPRVNI